MMRHTPGPWEHMKIQRGPSKGHIAIFDKEGDTMAPIATVNALLDEAKANAALIAAAPDLLEVLEAYLSEIGTICGANNREAAFLERIEDKARAAIAKATNGRE